MVDEGEEGAEEDEDEEVEPTGTSARISLSARRAAARVTPLRSLVFNLCAPGLEQAPRESETGRL